MPRWRSDSSIAGVKCNPAVGAATALPCLRVNGLVTLAIERFVRTLDIRRKRNVTEPVERLVETVLRFEPHHSQAIVGAGFHVGL